MIGGSRCTVAVAALALCAGCSSSGGQVICGPCQPPVTVTVTGFDGLAGDGSRVRICVGEMPCTDFRVRYRAGSASCGQTACSLDDQTGALHVTLNQRDPQKFADLPVRVTASSKKAQWEGTGTMKYVPGRKPCACPHSDAQIALA